MSIAGYYYLHTNHELIYKTNLDDDQVSDFRESDFVVQFWAVDPDDRAGAWTILVEALALGAKLERVNELAKKWGCTDEDAKEYAHRVGALVTVDGPLQCATRKDFKNLQESPAGFGTTRLYALADLCKVLGYRPQKTWGAGFKDLLK